MDEHETTDLDRTRYELRITCADAIELVTEYLDDALSPDDREHFTTHLAGCDACRVFVDQLRATVRISSEAVDRTVSVAPPDLSRLLDEFDRRRE